MLDHTTDGESGGEEKRVSNLVTSSRLFASTRVYSHWNRQELSRKNNKKVYNFSFFFFSISFAFAQLELCGGLTPISERSTRASCDDADSHTQVSLLLAEAEEPNANSNAFIPEDNNIARLCYAATVCQTTTRSFPLLTWHIVVFFPRVTCEASCVDFIQPTLKLTI